LTPGLDPDLGLGLDYQNQQPLNSQHELEQGSETKGLGHKQQQQLLLHLHQGLVRGLGLEPPYLLTAVALATALHQLEIKIYFPVTTIETGLAAMILLLLKAVCSAGLKL